MSPKEKPGDQKRGFNMEMTRRKFLQGVLISGVAVASRGTADLFVTVAPATNKAEEDAKQQYPRPPINQVRDAQEVIVQSRQNSQEFTTRELQAARNILEKENANRQEVGRLLEERGINNRLIRDLEFIGAGISAMVASVIFRE